MKKPNILMIMTDQHPWDWLSCAGTDYVETPNIDWIANRGIRFTNATCNSPLCAPSRAALAGGVFPHRVNVLSNQYNFPLDFPTYYQALRKEGYRVGMVGKSDLHKPDHFYGDGDLPFMYQMGFTDPHETEGKWSASMQRNDRPNSGKEFDIAGPYQKYLKNKGVLDDLAADYKSRGPKPVYFANQSPLNPEDFHDTYIARKASEFIDTVSEDSPWHMFVSFVGPHDPWDPPAKYLERYKDKEYPPSIQADMKQKPDWIQKKYMDHSEGLTSEAVNHMKRHLSAAIACIDDGVGRILDSLRARGLEEDTVILVCSDHGEMAGDMGLFQKTNMYEGSVRIPYIISVPRQKETGISDALVELIDLHPTILELAGADYSKHSLDGQSLVPLLNGETAKHKDYQVSLLTNCRMIRSKKYKFIENLNDADELYDLEKDPQEKHNIYEENKQEAKTLLLKLDQICK